MEQNEPLFVSDGLLMKYLLGEADVSEINLVQEWLSADEANRKQFEQFEKIWTESEALAKTSHVDENEAWERFLQKTKTESNPKRIIALKPRWHWWSAAGIVLIISCSYLFYNMLRVNNVPVVVWKSLDKILVDTLPDGSVITMNKNSILSFTNDFGKRERKVTLDGEAFFSVTKDKQKPFIVNANEAQVHVFGTTFNVNTTLEKTTVVVESGIVEVAKNDYAVRLLADEKATVTHEQESPIKEKNEDLLYQYYRSKKFILNSTPLWRFVDVLEQAYNVNIIIDNEDIKNMKLTTSFNDEPLQQILTVVGETLNITIEQRGTDIILH